MRRTPWWMLVLVFVALALPLVGLFYVNAYAAKVTPESVKTFFDVNAIIIMFVWGLLHKYAPFLAKWPNDLIPWLNSSVYVLTRLGAGLFVADAHAASGVVSAIPDAVGVLIGGLANATWARLLYEGWARALLEKAIGLKAAVPNRR